jgi:hypothetical protein
MVRPKWWGYEIRDGYDLSAECFCERSTVGGILGSCPKCMVAITPLLDAAPDLLRACRAMLEGIHDPTAMQMAREAIDKADTQGLSGVDNMPVESTGRPFAPGNYPLNRGQRCGSCKSYTRGESQSLRGYGWCRAYRKSTHANTVERRCPVFEEV